MFQSSFIPFEEQTDDIISNPNSINISEGVLFNGENYHSSQFTHTVVDSSNNIVVGK
jgi:hypothetical protein